MEEGRALIHKCQRSRPFQLTAGFLKKVKRKKNYKVLIRLGVGLNQGHTNILVRC